MGFGEVSRGEKMLESGTDPESYITKYTSVYEDNNPVIRVGPVARSVLSGW